MGGAGGRDGFSEQHLMPNFAANLSMLWPELDMYDRFRAAADAGFSRIEILFVHELDHDKVERLLREHDLQLVLFDPAPGNWSGGERGLAVNPARRAEFQASIQEALETARRFNVGRLNVITGIPTQGASDTDVRQTLIDNFQRAGAKAEP